MFLIAVTDSIGIEAGDSRYVLGKIADAEFTPAGTVLILDETEWCLREYSAGGLFLRDLSVSGYGPGEIGMPYELAATPDGRILVWDMGKLSLNILSSAGESIGDVAGWSLFPPVSFSTLSDDRIAGIEFAWEISSDDRVLIIIRPSVFRIGYTQPEIILFSDTLSFRSSERISSSPEGVIDMVLSASDGQSRIFYSIKSPSLYEVFCWNTDGEELFTATLNLPQVEKTPEDILDEEEYIDMIMGSADPAYQLNAFHNMVVGIGVDGHGNLWVQRGTEDPAVFDVFNTGGELIGTVEFPMTGRFWKFIISPRGALAWNRYPKDGIEKVFMLDLPDL